MAAAIDYNALGQCIDTTFGRSSTPVTATRSVKITLSGANALSVSFITIVNISTDRQLIETKRQCREEAETAVKQAVKKVKESYKELTGKTLKASIIDETRSDSLEIIGMNVHSPCRKAYFRYKVLVEVS